MLTLLTLTVPFPSRTNAQTLDPTRLVGRWSGTGTFFNADLQRRLGALPFVLELKGDNSGTGRVGEATLQVVRMKATRDRIQVAATLTGSIGADPALAKDHLVFVVTTVNENTVEAEFHLKSNSIYDPWMCEGRVVLTRVHTSMPSPP